jgi:hypothetical protein
MEEVDLKRGFNNVFVSPCDYQAAWEIWGTGRM